MFFPSLIPPPSDFSNSINGFVLNKKFFYPGDSLENPKNQVDIIAFPIAGSWLKLSEVVDWLRLA